MELLLGSFFRFVVYLGLCVVRIGGKVSGMWYILLGWVR